MGDLAVYGFYSKWLEEGFGREARVHFLKIFSLRVGHGLRVCPGAGPRLRIIGEIGLTDLYA
jgi:hypothetical protein